MRVCQICSRCYPDAEIACVEPDHPELIEVPERSVDMVPGYRIERTVEAPARVDKYLARQIESNAECMISVVSVSGGDPQAFLNDAKTAAAMFHPNIVDIYDSGVLENGVKYYVSERPRTETLRVLLNQGIPPLLTTIVLVRETAEAAHAMHSNGLVHGAIRPESILVAVDESLEHRVKLADPDFGGAVRHSIVSNKLTIDSALDTIRYFAPEQFASDDTTPKTDVYALGTLLFEMLAGEPPFGGESAAELIKKIRNEHPPEIEISNFDLRMLLTHTLMQSLQKQPTFRQPTALAFARQLRHMEQLATHSATPPAPFPGAIPQKSAAAAAVSSPKAKQMSPPVSSKPKDAPLAEPVPIQPLSPEQEHIANHVMALPEETPTAVEEHGGHQESTGDLNRFRLRHWKEKYQAVSSAFRSDSKTGLQQLSIATPPPPQERVTAHVQKNEPKPEVVETPKPTRIKIEWDQPNDDLPSLDDVRKVQAEGFIAPTLTVEKNEEPAIEQTAAIYAPTSIPAVKSDLFGNYTKRSRVKKRVATEREAGMFSAVAPLSGSAMNRRIIAAGFAVAVIVGLFFGSSLLERKEARSAAAETKEPKTAAAPVTGPSQQQPIENAFDNDEAIVETREVASQDAGDSASFALPKPSKPASKDTSRDPLPDKDSKISNSNGGPKVSNNNAPAKAAPKTSLTPSTLVISPGNGQVKRKVEPGNGSALTRPRIVANPRP